MTTRMRPTGYCRAWFTHFGLAEGFARTYGGVTRRLENADHPGRHWFAVDYKNGDLPGSDGSGFEPPHAMYQPKENADA